jgi:hypothetical protein
MCKALTNFEIVWNGPAPKESQYIDDYRSNFVALRCTNEQCGFVIGGLSENGLVTQHWPELPIDFPRIEDVPEHIARAAEEVHLDLKYSNFRSATMLARAVVEATCKEKGITSGKLFAKIEQLHTQGDIRALIKDAAHEIRHLGNDMAHGDFIDPITEEEATEIVSLMDELLTEVFQSPARISRVQQARLAKKGTSQGTI